MNSLLYLTILSLVGVAVSQRDFPRQQDYTLGECRDKVADIYFVLDSSTSIYTEDYDRVLQFVSEVTERFDINEEDTRIGALTFSDDFEVGFELNQFRSKAQVVSQLNTQTLRYRTGVTNTDRAIKYVRENQQFRQDITKVMVVITDGGSRSPGATRHEADMARAAGFHVVVVGVGTYLDEQEWRSIANDPDSDYVFNITNFNALPSLRDSLPRRVCLMPPIIISADCPVRQDADVLFVAGPDGLNEALDVITNINEDFTRREGLNVRYIMEICDEGTTDPGFAGPDMFCDRFAESTQEQTEDTYTDLLARLRSEARDMQRRSNNQQVAVLLVDDRSMNFNRFGIMREARTIFESGVVDKMLIVDLGVTRDYKASLMGITRDRNNYVDYFTLSQDEGPRKVLDMICEAINDGWDRRSRNPWGDDDRA